MPPEQNSKATNASVQQTMLPNEMTPLVESAAKQPPSANPPPPPVEETLQAENEALKRMLMDAQELLVKRNERLAGLEMELQSIRSTATGPPKEDDSNGSERPDESLHSVSTPPRVITRQDTPHIGMLATASQHQQQKKHAARPRTPIPALMSLADTEDESTTLASDDPSVRDRSFPPTPKQERRCSKKTIQPCTTKCPQTRGRIRRLPREMEMESTETIKVESVVIIDGTGEKGKYSGTILKESRVPHGKGRMVYDKNRSYMGEWEHGHWHGQGHLMNENFTYTGSFVYDKKDGQGLQKFANGKVCHGDFVDEYLHGTGYLEYPDGSAYKGDFWYGIQHGKGKSRFANGGGYVGNWKNGKMHGWGKCEWPDGSKYVGMFKEGKMHGKGIELRPDGTVRHEGYFENNEPDTNRVEV